MKRTVHYQIVWMAAILRMGPVMDANWGSTVNTVIRTVLRTVWTGVSRTTDNASAVRRGSIRTFVRRNVQCAIVMGVKGESLWDSVHSRFLHLLENHGLQNGQMLY